VQPTDIRTRLRDSSPEGPAAGPPPMMPGPATVTATAPATTQVLPPSAFRAGPAEDALRDALGYGLYARAAEEGREQMRMPGEAASAELVERYRAQATADLHAFAFRYLHNHAEQIRQDAIREQLGQFRRPPGFLKLMLATIAGVAVAGVAWQWLGPWLDAQGGMAAVAETLLARLRSLGA
jgi:phytoene dehydrogenase-like protein